MDPMPSRPWQHARTALAAVLTISGGMSVAAPAKRVLLAQPAKFQQIECRHNETRFLPAPLVRRRRYLQPLRPSGMLELSQGAQGMLQINRPMLQCNTRSGEAMQLAVP